WDDAWTPLLAMGDPGEAPLRGSLLVAPYGSGHYAYTGLGFIRQLPEGVPGAYRLLAHLVSLANHERCPYGHGYHRPAPCSDRCRAVAMEGCSRWMRSSPRLRPPTRHGGSHANTIQRAVNGGAPAPRHRHCPLQCRRYPGHELRHRRYRAGRDAGRGVD